MPQARTRLWFLPTSPRSPDKIRPELTILGDVADGRVWNREMQAEFFRRIVDSGTYESAGRPPKEPDQPGRERVHRAPRALGFVRAETGSVLEITRAGQALIEGHDPSDLFLHQLLKLQFPSPNHPDRDYRELFRIKPFREVLRLVRRFESISKFEMQAFGLTLTDYRDFDELAAHLERFRGNRAALEPGFPRRELEYQTLVERMTAVYADDLAKEGISLRERSGAAVTPEEVLATKIRNARDYADAAMRYFQRTGLFTYTDFRSLHLLPERLPDVDKILETVSPEPESYDAERLEPFWRYLGDPAQPWLPLDERDVVSERLSALSRDVPDSVLAAIGALPDPATASVPELKLAFNRLQAQAELEAREDLRRELAKKDIIEELVATFEDITRGGVIDRALLLEWNVWRLFAVLDDGDIRNNFKMDRFGKPVTYAPGNRPDVECEYHTFHMLAEVTVSRGARQHSTEGEPITRHVGLFQRDRVKARDGRPVYGVFVAERLDATVVVDLYSAFTTKARAWSGGVKIIPFEIADMVALLRATKDRLPNFRAADLQRFLERASVLVFECMDEQEWHERVRDLARKGL
jgi:hypothetical protein